MSARKLFNAKNELFAIMSFCETPEQTAKMFQTCRSDEWFQLPWAKKAYKRIKELYQGMSAKDGVIPFTTLIADDELPDDVKDRLESGRKRFKDEKIDVDAVLNSLDRYRKFRKLNEMVEVTNAMLADQNETDPAKLIEYVKSLTTQAEMSSTNIQDNIFSVGEDFSMQSVLEDVFGENKRTFIPTGIKEFDKRNGGISLGSTFLIAGTTGGGKTLTAMNVAENMAMYGKVAYVPLEMTATEMVQRQMAKHGRVPINKIAAKRWTKEEQDRCLRGYKSFHRKVKAQGNTFSIFKPDQDLTIDEIFMALHPYDYDVVCIDYISLLKGVDGDDAWRKLNEASRAAKVYASTHNKIVILLAQLNDAGELRYSKGLLDHFNNAWFFVANESTKEQGSVKVTQPKARNADPTPFEMELEYEFMSIGENSLDSAAVADPELIKQTKREKPAHEPETPKSKTLSRSSSKTRRSSDNEDEDDTPIKKRNVREIPDDDEDEPPKRNKRKEIDNEKERISPSKTARSRAQDEDDYEEDETPRRRKPPVSKPKRRVVEEEL